MFEIKLMNNINLIKNVELLYLYYCKNLQYIFDA